MIFTEKLAVHRQRLTVHTLSLIVVALFCQHPSQVVQARGHFRVLSSEEFAADRQRLTVQKLGFLVVAFF